MLQGRSFLLLAVFPDTVADLAEASIVSWLVGLLVVVSSDAAFVRVLGSMWFIDVIGSLVLWWVDWLRVGCCAPPSAGWFRL